MTFQPDPRGLSASFLGTPCISYPPFDSYKMHDSSAILWLPIDCFSLMNSNTNTQLRILLEKALIDQMLQPYLIKSDETYTVWKNNNGFPRYYYDFHPDTHIICLFPDSSREASSLWCQFINKPNNQDDTSYNISAFTVDEHHFIAVASTNAEGTTRLKTLVAIIDQECFFK